MDSPHKGPVIVKAFLCHNVVMCHYGDVIMNTMASQITGLTSVYLTDYSGAGERKYQSSASRAFVWRIHR